MTDILGIGQLSAEQILLVKSAVYSPNISIDYWQQWTSLKKFTKTVPADLRIEVFDSLDFESSKVMLLVYENLAAQLPDDPILQVVKSVVRHNWFRNQQLWAALEKLTAEWNASGSSPLVFHAGATALLLDRDRNVRYLGWLDIWCPNARSVLLRSEFADRTFFSSRFSSRISAFSEYVRQPGEQFRVHRFLLDEHLYEPADILLLKGTHSCSFDNGATVRLPSPTAHLFLSVIRGTRNGGISRTLWITEVYALLHRSSAVIQWDELLDWIHRFGYALLFREALPFLKHEFGCPIPDGFLAKLENIRVDPRLSAYRFGWNGPVDGSGIFTKAVRMHRQCSQMYDLFLTGNVNYSRALWMWWNYRYRLEKYLRSVSR